MDIEGFFCLIKEKTLSRGIVEVDATEDDALFIADRIGAFSKKTPDSEQTKVFDGCGDESGECEIEYIAFAPVLQKEKRALKNKKRLAAFALVMAASGPFVILAALAVLSSFGAAFALLGGLLAISFILIAAIGTSGVAIAILNLIYSVTKLFSNLRVGIVELCISIALLGALVLGTVLLYAFSTKLLPYLMRELAVLFRLALGKAKEIFYHAMEVYSRL